MVKHPYFEHCYFFLFSIHQGTQYVERQLIMLVISLNTAMGVRHPAHLMFMSRTDMYVVATLVSVMEELASQLIYVVGNSLVQVNDTPIFLLLLKMILRSVFKKLLLMTKKITKSIVPLLNSELQSWVGI